MWKMWKTYHVTVSVWLCWMGAPHIHFYKRSPFAAAPFTHFCSPIRYVQWQWKSLLRWNQLQENWATAPRREGTARCVPSSFYLPSTMEQRCVGGAKLLPDCFMIFSFKRRSTLGIWCHCAVYPVDSTQTIWLRKRKVGNAGVKRHSFLNIKNWYWSKQNYNEEDYSFIVKGR